MTKWYFYFLLVFFLWSCSHNKEEKNSLSSRAIARPDSGNSDKGRLLYNNTCSTCHGADGLGNKKLKAPPLTNIDGWYLYHQLMNFRNGIRGYSDQDTLGFQMAAMSKTLKDSIAVSNVVAYIKILPKVNLISAVQGDLRNGQNIYQGLCGSCHGPSGRGNEKFSAPRLNGLTEWYLKTEIRKFKNSIRGAHPDDKLGAQMVSMSALLIDDKSINDVVAYILSDATISK